MEMIVTLKRYSYGEFETEGVLIVGNQVFATIEQPWTPNPNGFKGGKPFESCIPDGMYRLTAWESPSKGPVYIIWNPDLGVYRFPQDHDAGSGRDLCLIHVANWARQIQGCIAPGIVRRPMFDKKGDFGHAVQAVSKSGDAMRLIRERLFDSQHLLNIVSDTGAQDE
jgi:hypothetical protein